MNRVVFKYLFSDSVEIKIPWWPSSKVRLITCQFAGMRTPTVWVEHPEEVQPVFGHGEPAPHERTFVLVGTGHPFDETGLYFEGSAVCQDGALVWHVYATAAGSL